MNTELNAMIEAGRKLLEAQAAAEHEAERAAEAETLRLKNTHLAKLPPWMHEYVTVSRWEHSVRIYLDLPGCAPMHIDSCSWDKGFARICVSEPLAILFDDDEGWYVNSTVRQRQEIETAVALAADLGESWHAMRAEAERRNAEGLRPEPRPTKWIDTIPEDAKPDAMARVAVALERIADRLDGFSDNLAEDALRVNVLR